MERERQKMGFATWTEAVTAARDRAKWRTRVDGPILSEERRNLLSHHQRLNLWAFTSGRGAQNASSEWNPEREDLLII